MIHKLIEFLQNVAKLLGVSVIRLSIKEMDSVRMLIYAVIIHHQLCNRHVLHLHSACQYIRIYVK